MIYPQNVTVEIKPSVFMTLLTDFRSIGFIGCESGDNEYVVEFLVENETDSEFLAKYDTFGFSVVDNTGKTYPVNASGLYWCSSTIGARTDSISTGSADYLVIRFEGSFPLEATYLDITIDYFSGVGPLTFRKDL